MSLYLVFRAATAGAQVPQQISPRAAAPNFWQAAGGIVVTNWIPWAYNWYVQRWAWANVGMETWGQNLRQGFTWDNDSFFDNQLLHPYHGSMYQHSARAAGYGFWSSFPFVTAGSATWELFGENIQASFNDLINTTIGGMALGEVTYRLSVLLRSGGGGGRPGLGRHLGAFVASPIGGTRALFEGASDDGDPALRSVRAPARYAAGSHAGHAFLEMDLQYGSPFSTDFARPYDAFDFRLRLSPGSGSIIQQVGVSGLLARRSLGHTRHAQLLFGVFQHYDYHQVPGINTSGHSLSAALLYQHAFNPRHRVKLSAQAEGLLLGSISSDHGSYWRRDYDLGPGAGARLAAAFSRDNRDWFRFEGRLLWMYSVHGSAASHLMSFLRAGAALPIVGTLGVGGEVTLTNRLSRYRDFPAVRMRVPEVRAFVSWLP
jgi:hypothetical protein